MTYPGKTLPAEWQGKMKYVLLLIAGLGTGFAIRVAMNYLRTNQEDNWYREQFDAIIQYNELIDELDDEL